MVDILLIWSELMTKSEKSLPRSNLQKQKKPTQNVIEGAAPQVSVAT